VLLSFLRDINVYLKQAKHIAGYLFLLLYRQLLNTGYGSLINLLWNWLSWTPAI